MVFGKHRLALLTCLLSLSSSPALAWDLNKYIATAEEPATASFCAIKNEYQEGIALTFVKDTNGSISLFFAFRDLTFPVPSNQLMNIIFKDVKNELPPKMFQGDATAIQEKLLKSANFGADVNLDLIGLYSNVEVVVANKSFSVPLLEDWRGATQGLKLCASEILPMEKIVEQTPVVQAPVAEQPVLEQPVAQEPAVKEQVKEQAKEPSVIEKVGTALENIFTLKQEEKPETVVAEVKEEPKQDVKPQPVVPPEAVAQVAVKKDYAFLKEVMVQSGLQNVEYNIENDTLVRWVHADMTGFYQEYKLADQEGHSTEKLTRIAENTLFSLRQLCAGAFVNDVGRIEHTTDKSFIRADAACSGKDKETAIALLFVEAGDMGYVFMQEDNIESGAQLIEFRNNLLKIIQKSKNH